MAAKPRPPQPVATPSVSPGQPPKHVQNSHPAAVVGPADFRPHKQGQVTTPQQPVQTAGVNPDPPAGRQAAADISLTVPYAGDSPTGYDPYTLGTM